MILDDEWIARAEDAAACAPALEWLRAQPRTVDDLCAKHPDWALWACQIDGWADVLGPKRLDACAMRAPWQALRCAAERISPERLDWCADLWPRAALQYAAALLSAERRAWCKEAAR